MAERLDVMVAQIDMHSCLDSHLAEILSVLNQAGEARMDLCIFPELTLTGFRGDVVTRVTAPEISSSLSSIANQCHEKSVAALVGMIHFEKTDRYNSYVFIDAAGAIQGYFLKSGLTETERSVFSPGYHHPTFSLNGVTFSAVLCREIEDHDSIDFESSPDVIFWPGYIGKTLGDEQEEKQSIERYATEICNKHEAFLVQVNWGKSHRSDISLIGSVVVGKTGGTISRLPSNVSAVGLLSVSPDSLVVHSGYD